MVDSPAEPNAHCPHFPQQCSQECMERVRVQFGSYDHNEPAFEDWCLYARAQRQEEEQRRQFESEKLTELRQRLFPGEGPA